MSGDIGIGKLITSPQERDAIHVAVAPVVADCERLYPGQPIRPAVDAPGIYRVKSCPRDEAVGIVDPFLREPVYPDQGFWMFLLPGSITSLRHDWTHPAFQPKKQEVWFPPKAENYLPSTLAADKEQEKREAEQWLRNFISRSDCPDYETVMATIRGIDNDPHQLYGNFLHFNGEDAHGNIPPEFWDKVEIVLGQKIAKEDRAEYFSCSC